MYVKEDIHIYIYIYTYIYSYDWFALLYSRNQDNNVKQLFQVIFKIYILTMVKKKTTTVFLYVHLI